METVRNSASVARSTFCEPTQSEYLRYAASRAPLSRRFLRDVYSEINDTLGNIANILRTLTNKEAGKNKQRQSFCNMSIES